MHRRYLPAIPLTLTLALLASCQAPMPLAGSPRTAAGPGAALAPAAQSTVRISFAGLRGWRRAGRHLSDVDGAAITLVRLTAIGPGIATPIVATAPFAPDGGALPAIPLAGEIAITVPAGKNRVFTLEGLDADGRVIAVMRTLGSPGGGNQRLTINANTDAAARVLASLLAGPQGDDAPDTAGIAASLTGEDITASLLSFVNGLTQYDAAANTFSGEVSPVNLRDRVLADLLRANGRAVLSSHAPDELRDFAGSTIPIRVVEDGMPVVNADVTLYDPYNVAIQTDNDGQASLDFVPPGTWTLIVQASGKTFSTTVTARDKETAALRTIDMALAGTLTLPELPAVSESDGFPTADSLPWVETLAGASKSLGRITALDPRVGAPLSQVGLDGTGATYVMSYGKVLKIVDENTVQVVARSAAFGADTGIAGNDLQAFAVASDGTVWVVDDGKALYRVLPGEMPVMVGTLSTLPDSLVHTAAGKLFARSSGQIDEIDPSTGAATLLAAVDGDGPLAADASGNLYAWTGSNLTKITSAGGQTSLGGGLGGDEDGASDVGRFGSVSGLVVGGDMLYVADAGNNRIRRVDLTTGAIGTVAGGVIGRLDGSFADSADSVRFNRPVAVAYDSLSQTLVVTDRGNHRICSVDVASSQATTEFALTEPDFLEGARIAARFGSLSGIAVDAGGDVFVSDETARVVWRVTSEGLATRYAGSGQQIVKPFTLPRLSSPISAGGLALYTGSSSYFLAAPGFVVDSLDNVQPVTLEHIRGVAADTLGHVFELIDETSTSEVYDRTGATTHASVLSDLPGGGRHLAVTDTGKYYIATASRLVEVDTATDPDTVRTILEAEVRGLCVDNVSGHVFVTLGDDAGGGVVKEIDPVTLDVTTLAGDGSSGSDDGAAAGATFTSSLSGIAIDPDGTLYVADGDRIRRILRF